MRGKVCTILGLDILYRITPAYAGKSLRLRIIGDFQWDHPRLCGEKSLGLTVYLQTSGSPPPMRGKGCCFLVRNWRQRITPAYAGKRGLFPV